MNGLEKDTDLAPDPEKIDMLFPFLSCPVKHTNFETSKA